MSCGHTYFISRSYFMIINIRQLPFIAVIYIRVPSFYNPFSLRLFLFYLQGSQRNGSVPLIMYTSPTNTVHPIIIAIAIIGKLTLAKSRRGR